MLATILTADLDLVRQARSDSDGDLALFAKLLTQRVGVSPANLAGKKDIEIARFISRRRVHLGGNRLAKDRQLYQSWADTRRGFDREEIHRLR